MFDLILADPPYASDWSARLARSGRLVDLLAPHGVLVVERSSRGESDADPVLELRGSRSYGEVCFDWYERSEGAGA